MSSRKAPRNEINPIADYEIEMTWKRTREFMRMDFARNLENFGTHASWFTRLIWQLMPNVLAVRLYRISRYFYLNGHGSLAALVGLVNLYITRTELPPFSSIGPGMLIGHATAVTVIGKVGKNFTAYGVCGVGSGYGDEDIGGGPGCPVIGDNVSCAHLSMAQGPIRVGDNVRFGPGAHVTRDVPANSIVISPPSRITRKLSPGDAGNDARSAPDEPQAASDAG